MVIAAQGIAVARWDCLGSLSLARPDFASSAIERPMVHGALAALLSCNGSAMPMDCSTHGEPSREAMRPGLAPKSGKTPLVFAWLPAVHHKVGALLRVLVYLSLDMGGKHVV